MFSVMVKIKVTVRQGLRDRVRVRVRVRVTVRQGLRDRGRASI